MRAMSPERARRVSRPSATLPALKMSFIGCVIEIALAMVLSLCRVRVFSARILVCVREQSSSPEPECLHLRSAAHHHDHFSRRNPENPVTVELSVDSHVVT